MFSALWLGFTILALICFGVVGLLQKLSTDLISAESALLWLIVGFVLLEPFVYPGRSIFQYSTRSIMIIFLAGVLNALGSWAILAAMKNGGKALWVANPSPEVNSVLAMTGFREQMVEGAQP